MIFLKLASIVAVLAKVAIISAFFMALNILGVFPEKMLIPLQKAMTLTQLITASAGAVIGYFIYITQRKTLK